MLQIVPEQAPGRKDPKHDQLVQKRFQLARLLRCTEEILICAQNSDWKSVEAMEQERRLELAACFSNSDHEDSPLIAEALATLVHMNKQITNLVIEAKQELVQAQQKIQARKNIANEYEGSI